MYGWERLKLRERKRGKSEQETGILTGQKSEREKERTRAREHTKGY